MKLTARRLAPRAALRGALAALSVVTLGSIAATSPTLDEVYDAAQKGHLEQAQEIMHSVLRAHPDSAKAHYVEAELLGLQGRTDAAREELDAAEHLAPGLPFARHDAVDKLRREIATPAAARRLQLNDGALAPAGGHDTRGASSRAWQTLLAMVGGALVAWALMALGRPARVPTRADAGLSPRGETDARSDASTPDADPAGSGPDVDRASPLNNGGIGGGNNL